MRDAGFHSHRAAKKGDGLAPSQSIDPHVPTGFEDRILLKLANRGRGVLGLLRSALADPECRVVADCVVKLFCPFECVRLIQDLASMRNVD